MTPFHCRSCGSTNGRLILDLGVQPLANNLLNEADLARPEPRFPLRVALCEGCWLLQITDIVPPVELFSEYLYFSSFSDALLRHAAESVAKHRAAGELGPDSFVVEIASNDGYLLRNFVSAGVPCLGIEPAANIAKVAIERGVPTVSRFFGREVATELAGQGRQADLILGNNVFAHAPDTNDFVAGLATLLKQRGRIALEFPYACDLVEHVEFDTVYHEHVFYFTLTALGPLFARHGLEIFDVERLPIHGGSLRLYAAHRGVQPVRPAVAGLLTEETAKGVASPRYYDDFGDRVRRIRDDLVGLVGRLKAEGRSIAAYGASAKGSTLLNYYGLGRESLDFVADRSTAKQGRLTPGTHLPIVAAEELARRRPDYALLLTWNFAEEILKQQQAYRDQGGRFIVPLPEVRTVNPPCHAITPAPLEGVWLIELEPRVDERGFFARTFCEREFAAHGLNTRWPQANLTRTRERGMIRGLHWQAEPAPEIKLVRCAAGAIWDVVVDVRPASPTFGRWTAYELTAENGRQLYVPAGFAHGFQCLVANSEVAYLMGDYYVPELARGLRWDDPAVGIPWPLGEAVLSERDRQLPPLEATAP